MSCHFSKIILGICFLSQATFAADLEESTIFPPIKQSHEFPKAFYKNTSYVTAVPIDSESDRPHHFIDNEYIISSRFELFSLKNSDTLSVAFLFSTPKSNEFWLGNYSEQSLFKDKDAEYFILSLINNAQKEIKATECLLFSSDSALLDKTYKKFGKEFSDVSITLSNIYAEQAFFDKAERTLHIVKNDDMPLLLRLEKK
jgi:hypothetical protein